jgi:glycosyltransferase involved in cell wall biosynthesis
MNLFTNDGNQHLMIVPHIGSRYMPASIKELRDSDVYGNIQVKRVRLSTLPETRLPFLYQRKLIKQWHQNARELLSNVETYNPDVVYGHNPMEFALAASIYGRNRKAPMIFESHGLVKDTLDRTHGFIKKSIQRIANAPIEKIERDIFNQASHIVVQTNNMKQRLESEYGISGSKIEIIYNGVDTAKFAPGRYTEEAGRLKTKLGIQDKVVFSYFGFLDHNNGIPFLLKTMAELPAELKNRIAVLIIGRGPFTNLVEKFTRENPFLIYLGQIEYEKIFMYYEATDVFVIARPSNPATENLVPMKLFEAMAMEKIVLVSNVGGMTETVRHDATGLIFQPNDQQDFINKIRELLAGPEHYQTLRKNARNLVLLNHDWNAARKKLANLYTAVAGKSET